MTEHVCITVAWFNCRTLDDIYRSVGTWGAGGAVQRAKITEKVHKPPLGVNIINFNLNGFNAFILVLWSPSATKKL